MAVDITKLVEKILDGKFSRKELDNLRKNAESRNVGEVITACDEMLSSLPKKRTSLFSGVTVSRFLVRPDKAFAP